MNVPDTASAPLPHPAWGGLLAVYFVLVGVPSGVTLVCLWLRSRDIAGCDAVERHGHRTALAALVLVSLLLIVDLGRPERFYLMLTRFDNLGSPIAVGAKLIALKTLLLMVALYSLERKRSSSAPRPPRRGSLESVAGRTLPWLLAMASAGLAVYPASVLARSWASPLAGSSGSSLIFVLTALLMGAAVAVLIVCFADGADRGRRLLWTVRNATLVLLALLGLAMAFEALSLGGSPPDRRLLADVATGGFATAFWGLVIGTGMVAPAAGLSLFPTRRTVVAASSVGVLIGAAAARYLVFAAGE